jgi:signal transduction histidine kinase
MTSPQKTPNRAAGGSPLSDAQRAGLEAWSGAAFVIEPKAALVVAANAAGRDLFPTVEAGRGVALDGAMPAVRRLREALLAEGAFNDPLNLVFWTARGIRGLACEIERVVGADGEILLLVKEAAGAALARQSATPPPQRSDADTLREIARRIREGQRPDDPPSPEMPPQAVPPRAASGTETVRQDPVSGADPAPPALAAAAGGDTEQPGEAPSAIDMAAIDVAELAHELKTPVSAIAAAAEIMKEGRFGDIGNARYAGYVGDIHASAQHALQLIERMLERRTPREDGPPRTLRFERFNLDEMVAGCVSTVAPLAASKGVVMASNSAATKAQVTADGTALKQIVLNLLTNAIKFTPRGGKITITTLGSRRGAAVLTVEDTGPGMSAGKIAEAMQPVPLAVPAPRDGGGFGIGLPLSHALAEAMGAKLAIESPARGGTRVTLTFPGGALIAI